ncbi:hypothetical protein C8A05DRAFT_37741, partial [Staphylotrichum tortipilum]
MGSNRPQTESSSSPAGSVRRKPGARDRGAIMRHPAAGTADLPFDPDSPPPADYRLRRASTFSLRSANEAFQDEIVDPWRRVDRAQTTWKSLLPVMLGVLPPAAGLFFKNGTSFFSDLTLLVLVTVFLHWSIVAPWKWYHAAQQVREDSEAASLSSSSSSSPLNSGSDANPAPLSKHTTTATNQATTALRHLRHLEIAALLACFLGPVGATYLLYIVREWLSRPAEGLVSRFNLGIFFLAAEFRPVSHSIRLVLAHTLHLQRVVHRAQNPYHPRGERYQGLLERVELLEARLEVAQKGGCAGCEQCGAAAVAVSPRKRAQEERRLREDVARDVRAVVDPDLDVLARAVRRCERKCGAVAGEAAQALREIGGRIEELSHPRAG